MGYGTSSCQQDGTWSETTLQCRQVVTCNKPLPPSNSFIANSSPALTSGRFAADSFIQYACIDGFECSGNPRVTCMQTGQWSRNTFSCERVIRCVTPVLPDNSYVISRVATDRQSNSYRTGDYITLACNPGGYQLSGGPVTLTCLDDASWTPTSMVCSKRLVCPVPVTPPNAVVRDSSPIKPNSEYFIGDYFHFTCANGFESSSGDVRIECLETGRWSQCSINCVRAQSTCQMNEPLPANSIIIDGTQRNGRYPVGAIVRFQCVDGYTLNGCPTVECKQDGRFETIQFTCQQDRQIVTCPEPVIPQNAYLFGGPQTSGRYQVGERITFMCNDGFSPEFGSSSVSVCQQDGSWAGCDLTCKRNQISKFLRNFKTYFFFQI